jgi:uncharacterized Zn finger protein (UPF0148 family)
MIKTSDGTVYCPYCEELQGIIDEFDTKEKQECYNCYKNFIIEHFHIVSTYKNKKD